MYKDFFSQAESMVSWTPQQRYQRTVTYSPGWLHHSPASSICNGSVVDMEGEFIYLTDQIKINPQKKKQKRGGLWRKGFVSIPIEKKKKKNTKKNTKNPLNNMLIAACHLIMQWSCDIVQTMIIWPSLGAISFSSATHIKVLHVPREVMLKHKMMM